MEGCHRKLIVFAYDKQMNKMDATGRFKPYGQGELLIDGTKFIRREGNPICKMGDIARLVPHVVRFKEDKPTRYGSFVVTVVNEDTDEEFRVYMPPYVADRAAVGVRFVYAGLQKKIDGSGHTYHDVAWAL